MKFTALATTAVLAALGTARATPEVRNVVTNADHEYFTRMHFQPPGGGYTPRSALMDHEIKPGIDSARYEKYGAEDWAAVVLLECKKDRRCKSCIAFLVKGTGPRNPSYWAAYLFDEHFSDLSKGYKQDPAYGLSIGYYHGRGDDPTPWAAEDDEQQVLDL